MRCSLRVSLLVITVQCKYNVIAVNGHNHSTGTSIFEVEARAQLYMISCKYLPQEHEQGRFIAMIATSDRTLLSELMCSSEIDYTT